MAELAHHERRDQLHRDARGRPSWRRKVISLALVLAIGPGALLLTASGAGAASRAKDFEHRPVGQAPCPEGKSRSATLNHNSFETSVPWGRFNNGWSRTSTSTPNGSHVARSRLSGGTSDPTDYFFLNPTKTATGRYTRLALASRGTSGSGRDLVSVNSRAGWYGGTSSWRGRILPITRATKDEGGWLNPWFEHRRTPGTATRWDIDNVQVYTCRSNATTRIGGSNKYETAAGVSELYPADQAVVFIARSLTGAIVASARAGSRDAPVLLVRQKSIPSATTSALTRLNPERIVIVGGTGAVAASLETTLGSYARSGVSRLGGSTPADVSASVAGAYVAGKTRVYITSDDALSRALPAAALAARRNTPLLLTPSSSLAASVAEQLQRIAPDEIVIIGGQQTISGAVANQLAQYSPTVTRIAGGDPYTAGARIAAEFPRSVDRSYLVSATWLVSGVAGVALAGKDGAPVLVTSANGLPDPIRKRLSWLHEDRGWVVGGKNALASIVRDRYGRTLP